jgi:hypothetical protein
MINTSILNQSQLAQIYLVANTPSYLFRHYKADSSIWELARRYSVDELVSAIAEIANLNERTLNHIVLAYAALVALSFKNPREVEAAASRVSFDRLNWAQHILALAKSQQTSTQEFEIQARPTVQPTNRTTEVGSVFASIEVS